MTKQRLLITFLGVLAMGFLGFWLAKSAVPKPLATPSSQQKPEAKVQPIVVDDPPPQFRKATREKVSLADSEADAAGALVNQRVIVFKDQAALEDFLRKAGNKLTVMGRLDALNALRIAFLNADVLAGLLDGSEEMSMIFPIQIPSNGEGTAQADAVPLGSSLLEWLGITGDNSTWGAGIKIAVLDTGVMAHTGTNGKITWINMLGDGAVFSTNGHGTAVASMINGINPLAPGVAPAAEIISVRIADNDGKGNSFDLASGIIAAVDAGATLINISMGGFGDSALMRNAIAYARSKGALIFAASGNNGINQVNNPAANQGVYAIGSVDANGSHMNFSNTGEQMAFSAPGFGVNAAYTDNQYVSVSGTSFSTPIFVASVAGVMSAMGVSAEEAIRLFYKYANDVGQPGYDWATGAGVPDIGRVLNSKTRGIYDAAIASQRVLPSSPAFPYGQIEVLVQNRGTETLTNARVSISTPAGIVTNNINSLIPQAVQVVRVPITVAPRQDGRPLTYSSQISLNQGRQDYKPSNNSISFTYVPSIR
ncbi:S8 family serine peptidase [Microcoleus sp. herbarium8]|uniref:S8 family peptidase n=1 Tax=Microcoleus sp. herbarium8 TaxID=3055436 RepID=UPI002FD50F49